MRSSRRCARGAPVAYTTVMTMMKILEEKGYLQKVAGRARLRLSARQGRGSRWSARWSATSSTAYSTAPPDGCCCTSPKTAGCRRTSAPTIRRIIEEMERMIDDRTLLNLLAWWSQIALVVAAAAALPPVLRSSMTAGPLPHVLAAAARCCVWRCRSWNRGRRPVRPLRLQDRRPLRSRQPPRFRAATAMSIPATSPVKALSYVWLAPLIALFAIVAIARLIWLSIGIKRLERLLDGAAVTPDEVIGNCEVLPAVAAESASFRTVSQPITFGLRRPVVCLPDEAARDADRDPTRRPRARAVAHPPP